METGEIYYFESDRARGHEFRNKYHVYICEAEYPDDGDQLFLFINKSNSYGDGFIIEKAHGYDFLVLEASYISCSYAVSYADAYIDDFVLADPVGQLRPEDIQPLLDHVEASDTLEERHIIKICGALRGILP